jgi:hypothetical protein
MNHTNDTPNGIGKILSNLQSLEFALRLLLYELQKAHADDQAQSFKLESLSVGEWIEENPLTSYDTLGQLIKKVNSAFSARGFTDLVDESVVTLRDAIAHGSVSSLQAEGPYSIFKFSKPRDGSHRSSGRDDRRLVEATSKTYICRNHEGCNDCKAYGIRLFSS